MLNRRENVKKGYVCLWEIKENEKCIFLGKNFFRHENCFPGSPKWMKSEVGKTSKYYNLFERSEDNGETE